MQGKVNFVTRMRQGISILFTVLYVTVTAAGKVIYVDDSANGANDGTSWADGYNYLQDALADANTAEKPVEIRVAQGVYRPDQGAGVTPGDFNARFQLINGVSILGGFAGTGATEPDARYIEAFKTILSGDLARDDAEINDPGELSSHPTRAENSITVVSGNGTDTTAKLDGVTITAGNQWNMHNSSGSPVVDNCTFLNARYGIANQNSSQILTACTFKSHYLYAIQQIGGSSITLINCLFIGNTKAIDCSTPAELTLHNCSFIDNDVRGFGMIHCMLQENVRMYDCRFINNIISSGAFISANVYQYFGQEFIAENCTFSGNVGDLIDSWLGNTSLSNCIFTGNVGVTTGKIGVTVANSKKRMAITNCLFAGNIGANRRGLIYSDSQYTTIRNCTFSDNSSGFLGNVLNLEYGGKISNCIFWGNNSPIIEKQYRYGETLLVNYSNFEGGWPGEGNIEVDPFFVSPGYWDLNGTPDNTNDDIWVDGDYHLQSQAGHWNQQNQTWVQDNLTSPCIDTGDPNNPIGTEPFPNGGRVNMGAYGAGDKASKSYFGEPVNETIIAGDINGDGIVDDEDLAILNSHWMMRAEDLINKPPTVRLIEPQDGDRIAWPGPATFKAEASDPDGQVDQVWFYVQYRRSDGARTIGYVDTDGSDGWEEREFIWPDDVDFGQWTAWAEAIDNEGQVSISPEITITLYRP